MSTTKSWYASKTIWGIVLATVIAVGGLLGIQPVEQLPDSIQKLIEIAGLVLAFVGRLTANKAIK